MALLKAGESAVRKAGMLVLKMVESTVAWKVARKVASLGAYSVPLTAVALVGKMDRTWAP